MIEFTYTVSDNVKNETHELLKIDDLTVLQFCEKSVFSAKDCWGLVRAMKQSWLGNR